MQWLINIMQEWIAAEGYLKSACVYRGDNAAWDWETGDFILDGNWHHRNLSAIIPPEAVAVSLKINLRASIANASFSVRKDGSVNAINNLRVWTQAANIKLGGVFTVFPAADRVIEYQGTNAVFDLCNMNVNGWWF